MKNLPAPMPHLDAQLHVRGQSRYVDDMPAPQGMLHAAVVCSPVAHGHLRGLDQQAALNIPGVIAILTAQDIPGENQIGGIILDEPLLAEGEVHFHGHPVALVVAETWEIAQKARDAVRVLVDPKPAILDPREAFAAGEIIATPRTFQKGDVEEALAQAPHVFEGRVDIGGQEHLYLETQRARAQVLEGRRLQVYSSTQSPYAVQKTIAKILGVPQHQVEVDVLRLGGGFGGKEDQATAWACLAALATWHTQKPVELVLGRMDDLRMTGKRHPYSADFKIGVDEEGRILGYDVRFFQNSGCSADLSTAVLERTLFHATNAYNVPHVRAFAACCRTNLPSNTAFRGFGGPQGMFVIESALAKVAENLGMSREEVQRKNLLREGDLFSYGQKAERVHAERTWDEAAKTFDLEGLRQEVEAFNQTHTDQKQGLAVMPICFGISFTATFLNQASALVHVYTDGSVSVSTGGVEMGQGLNTKLVGIAAAAFGIRPERVRLESTNTTRIANMSPSAASATTDLNGNATILAAREICSRLKEMVAREIKAHAPDQITIIDEQVLYRGEPTGWTWEQLVSKAYFERVALSAHAFYATPEVWFDKTRETGHPFAYHVYGAAIVRTTVDTVRGTYKIDTVRIVHDIGRSVNEVVDLGQVEGGLAQGLGWMTLEELAFRPDGRLASHALSTYKAPDAYFMPDDLQVRWLEDSYNPSAPYGSKAVGEPPLMYGIGAYFALRDAVGAFVGPEALRELAFDAPMTPEKVLMALHGARLKARLARAAARKSHQAQAAAPTP